MVDQGQLHSQPSKHLGGCTLQRPVDPVRKGTIPSITPSATSPSEPPGGPDLSPWKCPPSCVWLPLSSPPSCSSRRPNSRLEQVEHNLSVLSAGACPRVPLKPSQIHWPRHFRGFHLISCSLVARTSRRVLPAWDTTTSAAVGPRSAHWCSRNYIFNLSRLPFLKKAFEACFLDQVAQSLTEAPCASTGSRNETCWKSFQQWLQQQPPGRVNKGLILSFLHFL